LDLWGGGVDGGDGGGGGGGGGGDAFLAACSSNALSNDERNPSSSHDENVSVESPAEQVGSSYDGSTVAIHFLSSICFLVCLAQCRKMVPREKENDSPGNCNRTTDILTDKRRILFILSALLLDRLGALCGGVDRVSFGSLVRSGVLMDRRRIRFILSGLLEGNDDPLFGGDRVSFGSLVRSGVLTDRRRNRFIPSVLLDDDDDPLFGGDVLTDDF
jgi:hypothetical protein